MALQSGIHNEHRQTFSGELGRYDADHDNSDHRSPVLVDGIDLSHGASPAPSRVGLENSHLHTLVLEERFSTRTNLSRTCIKLPWPALSRLGELGRALQQQPTRETTDLVASIRNIAGIDIQISEATRSIAIVAPQEACNIGTTAGNINQYDPLLFATTDQHDGYLGLAQGSDTQFFPLNTDGATSGNVSMDNVGLPGHWDLYTYHEIKDNYPFAGSDFDNLFGFPAQDQQDDITYPTFAGPNTVGASSSVTAPAVAISASAPAPVAPVPAAAPPAIAPHRGHHCAHPGCGRSYFHARDLSKHRRQHNPNAPRYACPVVGCKYSGANGFKRRDKLSEHRRNRGH